MAGKKTIAAFAAKKAGERLVRFRYAAARLGPHDIEMDISHCGICHSDIHLIDDDWGMSRYPLVPGHEIVGTVRRTGPAVSHLRRGQRVGVGWQCSACGTCELCVDGRDNLCPESEATCVDRYGGFAAAYVVDGRFAFPIPEPLGSAEAAPLFCGGITVYSPLVHYGVRPQMRVGVVGVGGLGHLALQFARAFGCEVTAFSASPDKERQARDLGADRFVDLSNPKALEKSASTQDFILATAPADLDWDSYMRALRPDGRLCLVGVPKSPVSVHAFGLIGERRSVCGSPIGSRSTIGGMLDFAARRGIRARVEALPMARINDALDKVRSNRARYRMVVEN